MQFLHAALWSPAKATLLQAIKADWPLLTVKNASKHLEETMATHKGHLKRTKQNIRTTTPTITNIKMEPEDDQFQIKQEAKTHAVYALILDTSKLEGVGYSDLAGPFPYTCLLYTSDAADE